MKKCFCKIDKVLSKLFIFFEITCIFIFVVDEAVTSVPGVLENIAAEG